MSFKLRENRRLRNITASHGGIVGGTRRGVEPGTEYTSSAESRERNQAAANARKPDVTGCGVHSHPRNSLPGLCAYDHGSDRLRKRKDRRLSFHRGYFRSTERSLENAEASRRPNHLAEPRTNNARAESFLKTLKSEEVYLRQYRDLEDARASIRHFIEDVYNRKRLHSSLGYLAPIAFERQRGAGPEKTR